ncbi:MAG: hypothetical protein P8Z73_14640 [Desulfobacteraceae bacterium]|jgi:hypothetical protein
MFEPRKIEEARRLTAGQRVVAVVMNLMLLAELTWAMYRGQQDPGNLTAVFLRTFIPSAAATLMAARFLLRRMQPVPGEPSEKAS